MNHAAPVDINQRFQHLPHQRNSRARIKFLRVAIPVDGEPVHKLHHQIGEPRTGNAAIDQPRHLRMVQAG